MSHTQDAEGRQGAPPPPSLVERLMRPWVWKAAVAAYTLYIFLLIAFYMLVAARSLTYSYTISGQPQVESGRGAALRVGVFDINRGRFLPASDIRVAFVRGQDLRPVFQGISSPAGLADVNLVVPDVPPGPAAWRVELEPRGMETETVEIPVEVVAPITPDRLEPWLDATVTVEAVPKGRQPAASPRPRDEGTGPVLIELLAEGHQPIDGLRSVFFVQTTDRATGAPVAATVSIKKTKGMTEGNLPSSVKTSKGGLGAFSLAPIGSQEWRLEIAASRPAAQTPPDQGGAAEPAPQSAPAQEQASVRTVTIKSATTQYAMVLRDPIWSPDEALEIGVYTLHRSGPLYGDVYLGDRWLHGEVTGIGPQGGGFEIKPGALPRPAEGLWLARVQVYGNALQPGEAGDMRTIALPSMNMSAEDTLREILRRAAEVDLHKKRAEALAASDWLAMAEDAELHAQIAFWLSLLPRDLRQPILLKDTQQNERVTLSEDKKASRARITVLLSVSGGLGLLIVLFIVLQNFARVRRESRAMVVDLEADGELDPSIGRDLARNTAVFQLVLIFATIAVFFVAIVILLQYL